VLDLETRRPRFALAHAQRLVTWRPSDARFKSLLADAYAALGAMTPRPDDQELSANGQSDARDRAFTLTAEEEQKVLLKSLSGRDALSVNRGKAEALYKEAITLDPHLADPHCGLGLLFESENQTRQAAEEYRTYLELATPMAPDRLRIQRRLTTLTAASGEK